MISQIRRDLVLAIYPESRGFGFVLWEAAHALIDWGFYEVIGNNKNDNCIKRISGLLDLYKPDVILLPDISGRTTIHRTDRIQELNCDITKLAEQHQVAVHMYTHAKVEEHFSRLGA